MSTSLRATAGLALSLLAGCAALPRGGGSPALEDPASLATSRALAAPARDWPADDWWRAYGDAGLDRLIAEALAGSPDMAAAKARLEAAQALAGEARAALYPALSGAASVGETKQSYNNGIPAQFVPRGYNDVGRVTLDFSWELDFWGKNRAAVAAATSEARASAADAAQARLVLSTAVAAAWADLARLFAQRDVDALAEQSRLETLDLVTRRVANGLDTHGELEQALAGPAAARADLAATDEEIALTRDKIAALVGAGPDRGAAIGRPAPRPPAAFGLPPRLAADLIGRRPDIVAARWRASAAAERIGVATAQFYPDINLTAFIGYQSLGLANLFKAGSDIGQVGPALSLPIFEGGRLRAHLRGARADYDLAAASYDGALVQAVAEVADAAASERALVIRLGESRAALAADEAAYRIARLRYDGGLADYQSVLLVEDSVLSRRRLTADLEARAFGLDVALIRALGGGFREPVG